MSSVSSPPTTPAVPGAKARRLIRRTGGFDLSGLSALWRRRELLWALTMRDIKVRYKQSLLGIGWAVVQPLTMMLIFTLFFGRLAKMPSDGLPYPVFAFAALLPWQFFAKALSEASLSLVNNQHIVTKVYFPRLLLPVSVVAAGLVDFAIAFVILLILMVIYGIMPAAVAAVPLFLLLAVGTALAVSLWLSAVNVVYRDVRHLLPFLTQAWMFLTPVVYPSSIVPEPWRALYGLNPMVGVIEGFRWALTGAPAPDPWMIAASGVAVVGMLMGGLYYFNRVEKTLADTI